MGKAWKRLKHRQRTWGTPTPPPKKIQQSLKPPPVAIQDLKEEVVEVEEIAKEITPTPKRESKVIPPPKTKRIKRKVFTTKKK